MASQQLVDYIKNQHAQGYGFEQIRTVLLNSGYLTSDVDEALKAASARHVTTGVLAIAFISVLVLLIGVLVAYKLTSAPPADLSHSISLFAPEVAPGSDLVLSVTIINLVDTPADGLLDLAVSSGGTELARTTQSFTVKDQATLPVTIRIPAGASPGSAQAQATISYGAHTKTTAATFTITTTPAAAPAPAPIEAITEQPTQVARQEQQTCTTTCDDLNFCTQDSCSQGHCVHSDIIPCCGNHNCEIGETATNCAVDCAEEAPDTPAIAQQAVTEAPRDLSSALRTCQSLGQQNYVDLCLGDVSQAAKNKDACKDISSTDLRDGCYIQFAYSGDSTACPPITDPSMQNSCAQLIQLAQMKEQYPNAQAQ